MCKPVMVKNVAPNSGDGDLPSGVVKTVAQCSGRLKGRKPSLIKWFHSIRCNTRKATPKKIVPRIHLRAFALSPWLEAETANTIVKLDESRQKVITEAKTMLG